MKRLSLLAATVLAAGGLALASPSAMAQQVPVPTLEAGHALLTISAQGTTTRTPDMATYTAGVTTQGTTASEALAANSSRMTQVVAALKKAGIADKDIQTSNLNLNPVYAQPKRLPDGSYVDEPQRIIGYQANNTVSVRQRKLDAMGKVIDALVNAGANQVNGPSFALSQPDAAQDEARVDAMKAARARAELYARASGLRVLRILSINESGSWTPQPVMFVRKEVADVAPPAPPPPVAAGELELNVTVTVQFELGA